MLKQQFSSEVDKGALLSSFRVDYRFFERSEGRNKKKSRAKWATFDRIASFCMFVFMYTHLWEAISRWETVYVLTDNFLRK